MENNNLNKQNPEVQQMLSDIDKTQEQTQKSYNKNDELKQLSDKEQAELERFKSDTGLKRDLTIFVVWFTSLWSIAIIVFLFLLGYNKVKISDVVIITLLTETVGIILGLPLVVTSHFFP